MTKPIFLTKSNYINGLQCSKWIWLKFNDPAKLPEVDKATRELLKKRKPLFEAGFIHKDGKCYARADILLPVGKNEWDIYEVKSSTEVKEAYIQDIAFQKYCYESAGLKIRNCFVIHINNQYVRQGEIEVKELFVIAPVSKEVEQEIKNVKDNIDKLFKVIALKEAPEIKPGSHCCLGTEEYE